MRFTPSSKPCKRKSATTARRISISIATGTSGATDKGDSMQTRAVLAGLLLAATAAVAAPQLPPHNVEIRTLSNRADLISGGDALVEVALPDNLKPEKLALRLNGRDVRGQFQYVASGHRLVGLITGLVEGDNDVVAHANGNGRGRPYATLTITNHSSGGPVFSGVQMQPWICATKDGHQVQVS